MAHIAIVLTSLSETGEGAVNPGVWLESFAIAYYYFRQCGLDITLASPCGGPPSIYPQSNETDECDEVRWFRNDRLVRADFVDTLMLTQLYAGDIDGLFYAGGYGALHDLAKSETSQNLINKFIETGKPSAFVCHGAAALKNIMTPNGGYLVSGMRMTCYSNIEEHANQPTLKLPYLLETELRHRGAVYSCSEAGQSHCVREGLIITGQNTASVREAASMLVESIDKN